MLRLAALISLLAAENTTLQLAGCRDAELNWLISGQDLRSEAVMRMDQNNNLLLLLNGRVLLKHNAEKASDRVELQRIDAKSLTAGRLQNHWTTRELFDMNRLDELLKEQTVKEPHLRSNKVLTELYAMQGELAVPLNLGGAPDTYRVRGSFNILNVHAPITLLFFLDDVPMQSITVVPCKGLDAVCQQTNISVQGRKLPDVLGQRFAVEWRNNSGKHDVQLTVKITEQSAAHVRARLALNWLELQRLTV